MSYARKVTRGTLIVFIFSILATGMAFVLRMILTRKLTPDEFGLFYAVFNFVLFFTFFLELGMGQAMSKYIAEFRAKKQFNRIKTVIISVFSVRLVLSMLTAIIIFILSDFLAVNYFHHNGAALLLKILSLLFITSAFSSQLKIIFQGFQEMTLYGSFDFLKSALILIITIVLLFFGQSVLAPTIAYVLSAIILFIILLPFFLKSYSFFKYKIVEFKPITKKLIFFGLPVLFAALGARIISIFDSLTITYFRPIVEVGIYNIALPSALLFFYFTKSLIAVIFPMFSEMWARKDKNRLADGLSLVHKYSIIIMVFLCFSLFSFSGFFIKIFFGDAYITGSVPLKILLVGVIFFSIAAINNTTLSSISKPKLMSKIVLFSALINITLNLILVPIFGMIGAAITTAFSYLFATVLSYFALRRYVHFRIGLSFLLKILCVTIIFICSVYYIKLILAITSLIKAIAFGLTVLPILFAALLLLFRVVSSKELKGLYKIVVE